jgi:hypothetical protein
MQLHGVSQSTQLDSSSSSTSDIVSSQRRRKRKQYKLMLTFLQCLRVLLALPVCPGHVRASLHRERVLLRDMQSRMTAEHWVRSFRMNLCDVQELYAAIADRLHRNTVKAVNSSGSPIAPECRLLMAIRWLAGGSYLDLMAIYGVSKAAFFQSLWEVLGYIVEANPVVFKLAAEDCEDRATGFRLRQRRDVFRHVIGAVDGILIACQCPSMSEYPRPAQFFTRKGFYAFNCQAVCDYRRMFTFFAIDCPGSCHDSVAFSMSMLGKNLFRIPEPYYILGDAAYKVFDRVLVPYEGKGRNSVEQNFNFFQLSLHMNIECSFGLLVARWGVLWRPLRSTLQHNILTIRAVVALHNWCQQRNAPVLIAAGGGERGVALHERPHLSENGVPSELLTGHRALAGQRAEPRMISLRRQLAADIERLGMQRPCVSVASMFAEGLFME